MTNLSEYLDKYRKQITENKGERDQMTDIIETVCGLKLSRDEINFENGRLTIRTHPAKRQIIFMRKVELLSHLQTEFPEKRIFEIY